MVFEKNIDFAEILGFCNAELGRLEGLYRHRKREGSMNCCVWYKQHKWIKQARIPILPSTCALISLIKILLGQHENKFLKEKYESDYYFNFLDFMSYKTNILNIIWLSRVKIEFHRQ